MTDIATLLAKACIASQTKKADYTPEMRDTRTRFEASTAKERALRTYAKDLEDLAMRRSIDEDNSLGGYAETAAKRLAPIPQTFGEAAWRLPAIGAAGVGGYMAGQKLEETDPAGWSKLKTLDPDALHQVMVDAATNSGGKNKSQLYEVLRQHREAMDPTGFTPDSMAENGFKADLGKISRNSPTDIAAALQDKPVMPYSDKQKQLRDLLAGVMGGEQHIPMAREQIMGQIGRKEPHPGPLAELLPEFKPYRLGGAIAGLGMGSLATGAPLALKAMWQKRQGGEAAVRARDKMRTAIEQAEAEHSARQGLLTSAGVGA